MKFDRGNRAGRLLVNVPPNVLQGTKLSQHASKLRDLMNMGKKKMAMSDFKSGSATSGKSKPSAGTGKVGKKSSTAVKDSNVKQFVKDSVTSAAGMKMNKKNHMESPLKTAVKGAASMATSSIQATTSLSPSAVTASIAAGTGKSASSHATRRSDHHSKSSNVKQLTPNNASSAKQNDAKKKRFRKKDKNST